MYKLQKPLNIIIAIAAYLLLFSENAYAHSFYGPIVYGIFVPCIVFIALTYALPSDYKHLLKVSLYLLYINLIILTIGVFGESMLGLLVFVTGPYLIVFFIVGLAKKFLNQRGKNNI